MLKTSVIRAGLELAIVDSEAELAAYAADQVCTILQERPSAALGLPTGSSPLSTYEELVARYQAGEVDFSQARTFNLDEYVGLAPTHPQSYRYFMEEHLFSHVNVAPESIHIPLGIADDLEAEAARYEGLLTTYGPIDLQMLGLGVNGHIGFNEPGTPFSSVTHIVDLTPSTVEANARFFSSMDEVPRQAITMGISSILQARRILLLVKGEAKAAALKAALRGPQTPDLPASALQRHASVLVLCDRGAASLL